MDDKELAYAVKIYKKKHKSGNYFFEDFFEDIKKHISRRPAPYNISDPFILKAQANRVWRMLEMNMSEIVKYSELDMAKFARRFCIPYRTLQAWCDGTNPCPVYIKMMVAEILNLYRH